jgi:protein-disulfide isomerase/uncharacterized membrane protein
MVFAFLKPTMSDIHMNPISIPAARRRIAIMILLCIAGLAVSGELLRVHYRTHTDPAFHSLCAVNDAVNCETVALSPWSVAGGIPVCIWGLIGYSALLALLLWSLRQPEERSVPAVALAVTLAFLAVSAALAWISFTIIDSLCLLCMTTYAINLALAGISVSRVARRDTGLWQLVLGDLGVVRSGLMFWTILTVLAVGALAAVRMALPTWWDSSRDEAAGQADAVREGETAHFVGAAEPQLTIVEYSDYQCPFCRIAHRRVRQMLKAHADRVRLVHRQFPLDDACNPLVKRRFHPFACHFALAAECAGEQGRFWQMNDALFGAHDTRKSEDIDVFAMAADIGVDVERFRSCMQDPATRARLREDIDKGLALGLTGTPTFVVDDKPLRKALSPELIESLLQERSRRTP